MSIHVARERDGAPVGRISAQVDQEVLLFLLIGFFIQIAADFLYVYVSYKESYQPGHLVDLLWLLSVLLFGFSGYYSKSDKRNELWKLKSTAIDKGTAFPYVSILILLMLVFAISGYRQGFVIGALSFGGFFSGALIGLQVGPLIANQFADGAIRVVVSLVAIFALAVLGQTLAGWLGHRARGLAGRSLGLSPAGR